MLRLVARFASARVALASLVALMGLLLGGDASATEAAAAAGPVPADPTVPEFEPWHAPPQPMANPALAVAGGSMMGVGAVGCTIVGVLAASRDDNPGAPDLLSTPILLGSGVLLAVGIPLFVLGVRPAPGGKVTASGTIPVVQVRSSAVAVNWAF